MTNKTRRRKVRRPQGQLIPIGKSGDKFKMVAFAGRDDKGGRSYKTRVFNGDRDSALEALADFVKEIANTATEPQTETTTDLTFGKFIDDYLVSVAALNVSEVTLRGYAGLVALLPDWLRGLVLRELRADHLQKYYASTTASVARHTHSVIRACLRYANRPGINLVDHVATDHVILPKHRAREIEFLTEDQASQLLAVKQVTYTEDGRTYTKPNRYNVLFSFLLASGCRPSEAFGLQWSDYDPATGSISIKRTLQWHSRKQGSGFYYAPTKTKSSMRCVPLPAGMVKALNEHRKKQLADLFETGERNTENLIFTTASGTPISRRTLVRRAWKPALAAAGLPPALSLYCLRHSCASLLLAKGLSPKVISERLGHSSVTITLDTYAHVTPGMQEQAANVLDAALFG